MMKVTCTDPNDHPPEYMERPDRGEHLTDVSYAKAMDRYSNYLEAKCDWLARDRDRWQNSDHAELRVHAATRRRLSDLEDQLEVMRADLPSFSATALARDLEAARQLIKRYVEIHERPHPGSDLLAEMRRFLRPRGLRS